MARWFRFYDEALNDPKVQSLSPALFKQWVNILCVASQRNGCVPFVEQLAFLLRISEERAGKVIRDLIDCGLLHDAEHGYSPHNWDKRQYKSDASNDRVKRHRERSRNADCNVTVTPSETDTESDTEQSREERAADAPPSGKPEQGHLLPLPAKQSSDLKEQIFGPCLEWLAQHARPLKPADKHRPLVGRWLKEWGDAAVLDAFLRARKESPLEPVAWIEGALRAGDRKNGKAAESTGPDWNRRVEDFRARNFWLTSWGAAPTDPGCQAPAPILHQHGYRTEAA